MRIDLSAAHGTTPSYSRGCRCSLCRAARAAYDAAYHVAHREEKAAYRAAHREERAAAGAAYYAAHREEIAAYHATYNTTNPEQGRARGRNRRARVRGNGGTHTVADVRAQYKRQRGRCYWCKAKVADYHVDHVTPLALGGSNGPENLVITCLHCNTSKSAKHPMDFAGVMF